MSLPERLRAALVGLTPSNPNALDDLRALYAADMVFRDPIQQVHGIEEFVALNQRLLRRMRSITWRTATVLGNDEELFLEWRMTGTPKLGPEIEVAGVTRARARGGLIVDHRDYWDMGEMLASALPAGQQILHLLRRPFA